MFFYFFDFSVLKDIYPGKLSSISFTLSFSFACSLTSGIGRSLRLIACSC